ncbi:hypothetical protein [Brevibacterium sediminis]|nr:hypothetical protein [Brevibacterium sediminis]
MREQTPERVNYANTTNSESLVRTPPATRLETLHQQAGIAAEVMFYEVLFKYREEVYPYGTHHPGTECGRLIREAAQSYSIGEATLVARTYMGRYNELRRRQILPELSVVEVVKGLDWVMPDAPAETIKQIQETLLRWSEKHRRRVLKEPSR